MLNMMKYWTYLYVMMFMASCGQMRDCTEYARESLSYTVSEISFDYKHSFHIYDYFTEDGAEFFAYYAENKIYIVNLAKEKYVDSIDINFIPNQEDEYGKLTTFTFHGSNELYALLNEAIFHVENKKLKKIVPLNYLSSTQNDSIRFANRDHANIYYDEEKNELIGEVYCLKCRQTDKSYYQQKVLGGVNMETGNIQLYDISYPQLYIDGYMGFTNLVHFDNQEKSYISFPGEPRYFIVDRDRALVEEVCAKSSYQRTEAIPLDTSTVNYTEKKMQHLVESPFYAQILYDKYRDLTYRVFLTDIPLKREDGKYNTFKDKKTMLMVINKKNEVVNEIALDSDYNNYISFVGKEGLCFNYYVKERKYKKSTFKCFKFQE